MLLKPLNLNEKTKAVQKANIDEDKGKTNVRLCKMPTKHSSFHFIALESDVMALVLALQCIAARIESTQIETHPSTSFKRSLGMSDLKLPFAEFCFFRYWHWRSSRQSNGKLSMKSWQIEWTLDGNSVEATVSTLTHYTIALTIQWMVNEINFPTTTTKPIEFPLDEDHWDAADCLTSFTLHTVSRSIGVCVIALWF